MAATATTSCGTEFLDLLHSQPSLRSTCPCHLSWGEGEGLDSTIARSSSCNLSRSSCELTWTLVMTRHIPSSLWWKRVYNCHLRISSPRGNRNMAPHQASPYPCHRFTNYWSGLSTTPLTPKAGIRLQGPRILLHLLWTHLEQPSHKMEFVRTQIRLKYQDIDFACFNPRSLSVHVSLPGHQLLLQFFQRFSDNDLVVSIQSHGHPVRNSSEGFFQNRDKQ